MKISISQTHVELTPETEFERDVVHHLSVHGVKSLRMNDPCGASVLAIEVRPERLFEYHFATAEQVTRATLAKSESFQKA